MKSLILENVRCFTDPRPAPLAPVTVLVGENSTGKSTFLAGVRLAWEIGCVLDTPDFNEEPFQLGAFEQIANYRGGRAGRAEEFSIGFEIATPRELMQQRGGTRSLFEDGREELADRLRIMARFRNDASQPVLDEWDLNGGAYRFTWRPATQGGGPSIALSTPEGSMRLTGKALQRVRPIATMREAYFFLRYLLESGLESDVELKREGKPPGDANARTLQALLGAVRQSFAGRPYASAPIRTEPRRTYEILKDVPRPSGGHVPMILARAYGGHDWQVLEEALDRFGKASGLFERIDVKRLGRSESSPFQIRIKVAGPLFNIVDVGYGVSQVLPIVVDILQAKRGSTFLLQQPEVHLHPKAQAELGSLIGRLAKAEKKRFIIETHSDYLLDRLRMEVRDGKSLKQSDLLVLYFQRTRSGVSIHPLGVDALGNLQDVPEGYRQFFLDEEKRFMEG